MPKLTLGLVVDLEASGVGCFAAGSRGDSIVLLSFPLGDFIGASTVKFVKLPYKTDHLVYRRKRSQVQIKTGRGEVVPALTMLLVYRQVSRENADMEDDEEQVIAAAKGNVYTLSFRLHIALLVLSGKEKQPSNRTYFVTFVMSTQTKEYTLLFARMWCRKSKCIATRMLMNNNAKTPFTIAPLSHNPPLISIVQSVQKEQKKHSRCTPNLGT